MSRGIFRFLGGGPMVLTTIIFSAVHRVFRQSPAVRSARQAFTHPNGVRCADRGSGAGATSERIIQDSMTAQSVNNERIDFHSVTVASALGRLVYLYNRDSQRSSSSALA